MNASETQKTELAVQNLEPRPGTEKKLGFLSFGHWAEIPGSRVNSASDSLHQAIDLAVGAEDIGLDGAFFRVHHFDQQQATLNSARAQVQAAKAEISQLQAQLKDSRHQRGKAEIVAPVAGVIARRSASAGALTGGDALFHIIKDNQLELVAEADAGQLALLRPGLTATVTLADGEALPGTVRLLNPTLDGSSRRGAVRIALKTDKALFSGSYGEALLAVPQPPAALTLPETALVYDREGSASVWRVAEDGLVQRQPVQLGRRQRGRVEILHGLGASDRVIGRAGALVDEGDRVSPVAGEQV